MTQEMLINAVHPEQKRMANVEDGKLIEFNIQMSFKQPITGNIYKGTVLKVERGLQAAFVNFGGKKDGFLPLRDVGREYFSEQGGKEGSQAKGRHVLKAGQEILVQVLREVSGQKGALLTSYISLPGRYLVLLPNKQSSGVSRKIEDESDRRRLKEIVEQVKKEEEIGFIVRTAGMNRTKQELTRDYQNLLRLWREIQKKAKSLPAPALIYQESDFGVTTLRDYFTPEVAEILVDDPETFKIMRAYCKAVAPRNVDMIKLYKEKTPIFDKYHLEDQIRSIYQERVTLKSGGYVIIKPTEAMITIDVNSGKGSNKRNIEETAFKTNIEAAEEIAMQLRLRDLGGLIAIDFIDMMDRKNIAEVEKTFKKALSIDRARIQLARISKFGILELSRQKKHSTIQEISYTACPFCHGSGNRPSLEYTALGAFRKIESQAVKGAAASIRTLLHPEVASYLQNQKRSEICKLETTYDLSIQIISSPDKAWDDITIETAGRAVPGVPAEAKEEQVSGKKKGRRKTRAAAETAAGESAPEAAEEGAAEIAPEEVPAAGAAETVEEAPLPAEEPLEDHKKKPRRRRRSRHKKPALPQETTAETAPEAARAEAAGEAAPPPPPEATNVMVSLWNHDTTLPTGPERAEAVQVSAAEEGETKEAAKPKRRPYTRRRKKKTAEEVL